MAVATSDQRAEAQAAITKVEHLLSEASTRLATVGLEATEGRTPALVNALIRSGRVQPHRLKLKEVATIEGERAAFIGLSDSAVRPDTEAKVAGIIRKCEAIAERLQKAINQFDKGQQK